MVTQEFERWLTTLSSSSVTEMFLWVTIGVLVLSLLQGAKGRHSQFLEYAPTLMTSLGILGTFIGVVIGLLHFDTQNIDQSIPKLLDGLKTAFITSIVGMLAAMIFNAMDAWKFAPRRQANGVKHDVTPSDIHAALEQQTALLQQLSQGLSGSEEGSLVGQVRFLRADVGDFSRDAKAFNAEFSRKLWQEMANFAEMMSRSATSVIIEALQQVIQDFNNNLMEQFGENFKALDASVKKLVDWQIEYKSQVEQMSEQYQQSVDSLVSTRQAVAGIWEECKEIPLAMAELRDVLLVNQHQIQELQRHLDAFIQMRDAAVNAVPTIQAKVEEIGDQLLRGAGQMKVAMEAGVDQLSHAVTGVSGQLEASSLSVQEKLEDVGQKLLNGSNEMRVALEVGAEDFRNSVSTTQSAFAELSHTVKNTSEQLSETLKDTAMEVSNTSRDMLGHMQGSVQGMQKDISQTAKNMEEHSQQVHEQFRRTASEFEKSNSSVVLLVAQTASRIQDEIKLSSESMLQAARQQIEQSMSGLDAHMRDAVGKTGTTINKQLEQLEMATAREIEKAMTDMGSSLVQITSRFVKDYEQMVGRMDDVIRMNGTQGR
ncbi:Apolipoprotein A1/A4/E domain protein [compost metagenome]